MIINGIYVEDTTQVSSAITCVLDNNAPVMYNIPPHHHSYKSIKTSSPACLNAVGS